MNKVIIIGNLTKDPEIAETTSGVKVAKLDIAVNRPFANADGQKDVDFFKVVAWRGLAENVQNYLKKGNKVAVEGSLQNRNYEDKDGNNRVVTEIIANNIDFLTPKPQEENKETVTKVRPTLEQIDDNKLPF